MGAGDRLIGTVLDDRYRIERPLGSGGMGTVYRGTQISVGREVAIKVVNPEGVRSPEIIKRFVREARLTSQLLHPNAVSVLDFGQTRDGVHYLVMELLSGRTLEQVLAEEGRLAPERVVRIGAQVCAALLGAHHLSILHRDLKPANIIVVDSLASSDHVKVVDFGVAKSLSAGGTSITRVGALLGTPTYMPPEVLLGGSSDHRSDLYSLGVILHELVTGRTPYQAETVTALMAQMALEEPPSPHQLGVPAPLADVIARLTARDPADRYPDAAHALAALGDIDLTARGTPTPVPGQFLAPAEPARRGWPIALVCGAAVALCGAALLLGLLSPPAKAAAPEKPAAATVR